MTQISKRVLPEGVESYARTPTFTSKSVPEGLLEQHEMESGTLQHRNVPDKLLNDHDLKAGTWGQLTVVNGQVQYFLAGADSAFATVTSAAPFVILPEESHYIQVSDDVIFYVEFFR